MCPMCFKMHLSNLKHITSFLRSILFSFLLRITKSQPIRLLSDEHLRRELAAITCLLYVEYLELDLFVISLSPFDDAALVIRIGRDHQLQVEVGLYELVDHEFLATE